MTDNVTFSRVTDESLNKSLIKGVKVIPNNDMVNHPSHYQGNGYEVLDVIDDFKLNYSLGNAIKYILRAGKKDPNTYIQDIEKAIFMLQHEVNKLKK